MAEDHPRLAEIARRQTKLREDQRFYSGLLDEKKKSHERRKRLTTRVGIGIGIASAGLGFVVTPWVGVIMAAAGIGVPLWGERQDAWDQNVIGMATRRLRLIEAEADALALEVNRLRAPDAPE